MIDPSNPLRLEAVGVLRNSRRRYDAASKRRLVEACLQSGVSAALSNMLMVIITSERHRADSTLGTPSARTPAAQSCPELVSSTPLAMAKAIASGDSRLMRKAGLESEIARLQRQRAAHVDDQHAIRRQIRDARYNQTRAERRIEVIINDLAQRQSTCGELFTVEIEWRAMTQRKPAGASLLTKIRTAARERIVHRWTIGRVGGFHLTCDIRLGRREERLQPELVLARTNFPRSIDIDGETTAIGTIAPLEHILDRMEAELDEQRTRRRRENTVGCLPTAAGETLPLQGELAGKLEELAEIEADLAGIEGIVNGDNSILAPV